ncbi:MAG TPA: inositol monophosphatase family protein [Dehalococcoidia bacterium]|nr:inositol monophosphatase family protein [Dehalococcoidia bacterium]
MSEPSTQELLDAAVVAARAGAEVLRAAFGSARAVAIKSDRRDLVTQADLAAERAILALLAERWPQFGLLAEESGRTRTGERGLWVIDPLDGTANFARGYPVFCVSIALVDDEGPRVGVVLDPLREELFAAARGEGATLNGTRLRVSSVERLEDALFSSGFPYQPPARRRLGGDVFTEVMVRAAAARRSGSAALDLAYIAAGRSEAHYELHLAPHDVAAGVLLVAEAGGRVQALLQPGEDGWPIGFLVSNGASLHEELAALVAPRFGVERAPLSFRSLLTPSG